MSYWDSLLIKRRLFVAFHHKDDYWRDQWDRAFGHLFVSHSVPPGDIDDSNSAAYIKRLIQMDYVRHASVVVVLIGPQTYCRKHVDWEISAGLNKKLDGYSGLLGVFLPNHPDYGKPSYTETVVPPRLVDNLKSGYARGYHWTIDPEAVKRWVEFAFTARIDRPELINNSRPQFAYNSCG